MGRPCFNLQTRSASATPRVQNDETLQYGSSLALRSSSLSKKEAVSILTRRTTAPIGAVVRSSGILVIGLVVRNGWGDCVICPII